MSGNTPPNEETPVLRRFPNVGGDVTNSSLNWVGVRRKDFATAQQQELYRLLRTLRASQMYPLDVKNPTDFHTELRWGAARGQPIGRYYLHRWLEQIDREWSSGPQRCLEIGDGHFIKESSERAWAQKQGKMLTFCEEESLSLDLSDDRADMHADLEDPFATLKEKHLLVELEKGFDVIVCAQVFEHIDYPVEAIKGLADILRPGGVVLFSVPFISNPVHGHDVHRFTTVGVSNLAKKAGLTVISNEAMGNSLVTIGYLLELASDDFTEEELLIKDPHQYVGVYAVLSKPSSNEAP